MTFKFSERSLKNLEGVHPDLVKVMNYAITITPIDFGITCGVRTWDQQLAKVAEGFSTTTDSYHLIQPLTGFSHAVDIATYPDGKLSWKRDDFGPVLQAIITSAIHLGIDIGLGGLWRSLIDAPHIQLSQKTYPRK